MSSVNVICPYCGKTYPAGEHCPYCLANVIRALTIIRGSYGLLMYLIKSANSLSGPAEPPARRRRASTLPLRLDIMDLMREIKDTVYEFARILSVRPVGGVKQTCKLLLKSGLLEDSPMTGAYSELLTGLARACQAKLDAPKRQAFTCLNPECRGVVRLQPGVDEGRCLSCGSRWARKALEKNRNDSILLSQRRINSTDLARLLSDWGFKISGSTIRSWARQGKISPANKQGYKVSEVYLLRTERK